MRQADALDWLYDWGSVETLPIGRPILIRIGDHLGLAVILSPPVLLNVQWRPLMGHRVEA